MNVHEHVGVKDRSDQLFTERRFPRGVALLFLLLTVDGKNWQAASCRPLALAPKGIQIKICRRTEKSPNICVCAPVNVGKENVWADVCVYASSRKGNLLSLGRSGEHRFLRRTSLHCSMARHCWRAEQCTPNTKCQEKHKNSKDDSPNMRNICILRGASAVRSGVSLLEVSTQLCHRAFEQGTQDFPPVFANESYVCSPLEVFRWLLCKLLVVPAAAITRLVATAAEAFTVAARSGRELVKDTARCCQLKNYGYRGGQQEKKTTQEEETKKKSRANRERTGSAASVCLCVPQC